MGRGAVASNSNVRGSSVEVQQQVALGMQQQSSERIVYLSGEINEDSVNAATIQLMLYASLGDDPVNLVLSTYGGSCDEMFSLYDAIKFLSCPVHTIGLGKIMSAGVLLLASGEKGKRLIGPSARVMVHAISSGVWGNVFDIVNEAKEIERMQKQMFESILKETKFTKEHLESVFRSKSDTYFSAEESIKYGIADKVIGSRK